MTNPNANVTIQFLAKNATAAEFARLESDLDRAESGSRAVGQAADGLTRSEAQAAQGAGQLATAQASAGQELTALAQSEQQAAAAAGTLDQSQSAVASSSRLVQQETEAVGGAVADVTRAEQDAAAALAAFEAAQGTVGETAEVVFTRIQDDVRTATADFKAGIISIDDWRVALQVARKEAIALRQGTALGGKELALFSGIMDQTAQHTQAGTRGARSLTNSILAMIAPAIGANGALGQMARTAMYLGAGGVIAGAVALGVQGLIALYDMWSEETRQTKKAHDDLYASIDQAAQAIIPKAVQIEQQRNALEREGAELTHRRLTIETALNFEREKTIRSHSTVVSLETELERLQQAEVDRLVKLAQLRRIASDEQTKAFDSRSRELELQIALTGKDADQQFALRLELAKLADGTRAFTPVQAAYLVQLELELERQQDLLTVERERDKFFQHRIEIMDQATPKDTRIRGVPTNPKDVPKAPPAEVPQGEQRNFGDEFRDAFNNDTIDGITQANDEIGHLGETVAGVVVQGLQLQDAFVSAFFAAEEGSKSFGKAFGEAIQRGVAQAAASKGAFYLQEAFAALGVGILGDPKGFLAAGKFFAAAAGMFALAHVAAGGVSMGGSGGSAGGGDVSREARTSAKEAQQPPLKVYINGEVPAFAPALVDTIAQALGEAANRGVVEVYVNGERATITAGGR